MNFTTNFTFTEYIEGNLNVQLVYVMTWGDQPMDKSKFCRSKTILVAIRRPQSFERPVSLSGTRTKNLNSGYTEGGASANFAFTRSSSVRGGKWCIAETMFPISVAQSTMQGVQQLYIDQQLRLFSCGADASLKFRTLPSLYNMTQLI